MAKRPEPRKGHDSSSLHSVQTGSTAHPAFYPMDTGALSPLDKAAGRMQLTIHLLLVPRSRIHGYIHQLPQYIFMALDNLIFPFYLKEIQEY
jgi:hypothetical protein